MVMANVFVFPPPSEVVMDLDQLMSIGSIKLLPAEAGKKPYARLGVRFKLKPDEVSSISFYCDNEEAAQDIRKQIVAQFIAGAPRPVFEDQKI